MRLSATIYFFYGLFLLPQYGIATPALAPIVAVQIVTEYVVVPEIIPRGAFLDERSSEDLEDRSLICKIDAVFLAFKAVAALASPFCSSYLHIPTSTYVTVTTPITTSTVTDTSTYTSTTVTVLYTFEIDKRAQPKPIPTPPGIGIFVASQISSACSCLSIPESVVSTTSTAPTDIVQWPRYPV
ncbi:hypothetical protein N431DRAFT_457390 [Stipitochalara longipes BDJ]|nr:hypothetical protein N431DRAFT_457390 [Stipitochalara longipes BDJ]